MPPEALTIWLRKHYPKPTIDPEWFQACYDWIIGEKQLNPASDIEQIIREVEVQLLESDLRDSMVEGTGIPTQFADPDRKLSKLTGPPILVQIEAITDIGTSAYNLNKTRIIREERREAGEVQEGEADGEVEGEGPIPNYTRSMLKLEISDGATRFRAAEFRPIPELALGATPLGYKLQIQNAEIRRGIILLEPRNITLKGHMVSEREENQETEFARGLRQRLGLPEPDPDPDTPASNSRDVRSPLRAISPPPSPTLLGSVHSHSDDEDQPRRRRIPNMSASTVSTYLNDTQRASSSARSAPEAHSLSPVRTGLTIIRSDDEEENVSILSRPVKPIPARARKNVSSAKSLSSEQNKGKAKAADSDDYEDIFGELPASFFEQAAQIELAEGMKSMPTPSGTSVDAGSSSIAVDRPASYSVVYGVVSSEAITISDDDEDEKENVPAPTRRVRPRTAGRPVVKQMSESVIEITDSDSEL